MTSLPEMRTCDASTFEERDFKDRLKSMLEQEHSRNMTLVKNMRRWRE